MKGSQVRTAFLNFFRERGHVIHPSDSLIPTADPSLLFTGAGMNQFKDMFLGRGTLPFKRAATSQKCLRTGDIENVGKTPSHHTFFEMLGNFSFGDYFKKEAIVWAWEWVTGVAKLPESKLFVSVYKDDDEAFEIWKKLVGLPEGKIYRFGEHDNFWPADAPSQAPEGTLCGPCSEIFYDWGERYGCGRPDCSPACDCRRYVEVWNLVFQQFEKGSAPNELRPLRSKNIDTGMGLERIAAVLQGVRSNFETDLLAPLVRQAAEAAERKYGADAASDRRLRRIADHARAVTFAICDGALPSNEGRGYVVRRLLRRAVLDGRWLGVEEPFLYSLVPTVAAIMGDQYPELIERRERIASFVKAEEERFGQTLSAGLAQFERFVGKLRQGDVLDGVSAFTLYDTYGFPVELTEEMLAERGMTLDRDGFTRELERARERSRGGTVEDIFGYEFMKVVKERTRQTRFLGYEVLEAEGKILAIVRGEKEAAKVVDTVSKDDAADNERWQVVLDATPFYGESGGQVGDKGVLAGPDGALFEVEDTQRSGDIVLHIGRPVRGELKTGLKVQAKVDAERRLELARSHTATHILHHQLRELLGPHVEQAGSLVEPGRLRLDFTHGTAMSPEELETVERAVNAHILTDEPVETVETTVAEARRAGAMALFGEKYGERVRMVSIGNFSKELCGGTHLRRTGQVGLFRIVSEESVAAGVRRIVALTGFRALESVKSDERILGELSRELKAQPGELLARVKALTERVKKLERELEAAKKRALAGGGLETMLSQAKDVEGISVLVLDMGESSVEDLRASADVIRPEFERNHKGMVLVLAGRAGNKASVAVWVSPKELARRLKAGAIVKKLAAILGGGGGGRDDYAQAGGPDPSKIGEALASVENIVRAVFSETPPGTS